jgi:hypothetical protein
MDPAARGEGSGIITTSAQQQQPLLLGGSGEWAAGAEGVQDAELRLPLPDGPLLLFGGAAHDACATLQQQGQPAPPLLLGGSGRWAAANTVQDAMGIALAAGHPWHKRLQQERGVCVVLQKGSTDGAEELRSTLHDVHPPGCTECSTLETLMWQAPGKEPSVVAHCAWLHDCPVPLPPGKMAKHYGRKEYRVSSSSC